MKTISKLEKIKIGLLSIITVIGWISALFLILIGNFQVGVLCWLFATAAMEGLK